MPRDDPSAVIRDMRSDIAAWGHLTPRVERRLNAYVVQSRAISLGLMPDDASTAEKEDVMQDRIGDRDRNRDDNAWHLDKKVPIALIVTVLMQGAGTVWWASGMSHDADDHRRRIERLEKSDDAQTEILRVIREQYARIDERLAILLQQKSAANPRP